MVLEEITKDQHPKIAVRPSGTFALATEPEQTLAAFLRSGTELLVHHYQLNDKATKIYRDNPERFPTLFSLTVDQRAIAAYQALREQSKQ